MEDQEIYKTTAKTMQYEERIHPGQGNYLVASSRDFENVLRKEPLIVKDLTVMPGELTTLYGWFDVKCQFVGMMDHVGKFKKAVFYLGEGTCDLFSDGGHYYDVTLIIDKNQIGKSYRKYSFRNSFLHERNGHYYWK